MSTLGESSKYNILVSISSYLAAATNRLQPFYSSRHPEEMIDVEENLSRGSLELIRRAIDMHVHTAPSLFPRLIDDFELSAELINYGMRGAVIKSHAGCTASRAVIANKHSGKDIKLYGSLTLNCFVGGLNPYAVDSALSLGAAVIWMPTIHAQNHFNFYGGGIYRAQETKHPLKEPKCGISILNENDKLVEAVYEIIDLVASNGACLATGHLSNKEAVALCEEAVKRRVEKIIFTHPDFETSGLPLEEQIRLAKMGIYMEKTMLSLLPAWGSVTPDYMAHTIKHIGASRCIMATDFGQVSNPSPPIGLARFVDLMLKCGIGCDEIGLMLIRNPEELLS